MISLRYFLALCVFAGGALSVAQAAPATSSAAARPRVVILGDSITAGHGLSPSDAYPAVLQQKVDAAHLNYQVVNAGVSGDTTAGGLRRIDWALSAGAKVLVIALGGNDGLRGISPKQTEANLTGIIEKAKAKVPGLVVIVAGMQMPASMGADFAKAFAELYPKVAQATGATFVPSLLKGVGGIEKLNQPDFIHPTAEGQRKVAENVWAVLHGVLAAQ